MLLAFFRLIRLPNLLMMMLTQYLARLFLVPQPSGALFGADHYVPEPGFLFLMFSTLCIAAAGYIINDYYDQGIDAVNKPAKVFIGRQISERSALIACFLFNSAGLAAGVLLSQQILAVNVLTIILLWLYARFLKKTPFWGNLLVALLSAAMVLLICVYEQKSLMPVYAFALFAFWLSLIREIVKDIEDIQGDRLFGARTLPVVFGIGATRKLLYALLVLLIALLVAAIVMVSPSLMSWYFTLLADFMLFFIYRLYQAVEKKDYSRLSWYCKLAMLSGILAMMLMNA